MDSCKISVYVETAVMLTFIGFICALGVCVYLGKLVVRFESEKKLCTQAKNSKDSEKNEHGLELEQKHTEQELRIATLTSEIDTKKKGKEEAFKRIESLRSELETERQGRQETLKRIAALTSAFETERTEKEEALKRLSSIMSSRLRDGNPNVADLNDQNRPVKIGEQFSELYDNQWTDAYDAVEKHFGAGTREDVIIKLLLDILELCFMLCKDQAEKQLSAITENLRRIIAIHITEKRTRLPEDLMQRIKEERKLCAIEKLPSYDEAIPRIKQYLSHQYDKIDFLDWPALKIFVNESLKICWLMLVQDPPMTMILKPESNENDKFKAYKTRGNGVAFVVWPALLLKEGGAVLQKGVAEFCD